MTELSKYVAFDFSEGLDIQSSPAKPALRKNQNRLLVSQNTVYETDGGVSRRLDRDIYNTGGNLGATVKVTGGIQYAKSDGTYQIICGTSDGRLVRLMPNGTTTDLATGYTINTRWSFCIPISPSAERRPQAFCPSSGATNTNPALFAAVQFCSLFSADHESLDFSVFSSIQTRFR